MFSYSSSRVVVRRLSRIAFGLVLIGGAIVLVESAASGRRNELSILFASWGLALGAAVLVHLLAPQGPDADRLGVAGLLVPVVGIALLAPLTLHALVAVALRADREFEDWVQMSLVITGLAHLTFAGLAAARAADLVQGRVAMTPARIYKITIGVACVPFVVLYAIPPALVALTGLPLLPVLHAMRGVAERERLALQRVNPELAFAIARTRSAH